MIIKNIKLENFGAHKSIDFNTEGEKVIGLLGTNGSGKTTILSAIKFALTGDLEDTIESNVRAGATSGKVELVFVKNGKEGKISRTVGKISKADLKWEDKKYTAKKEIEKVLRTLVGGDKQALSNAVFMGQGSLNKLLFGSESEREQLFVRLNNLSYLQKFSDILEQKSRTLNEDLGNLVPMMDSLNQQRLDLVTRKSGYEDTLKEMEDLSGILSLWSELSTTETLLEQLKLSKFSITLKMSETSKAIADALGGLSEKEIAKQKKEVSEALSSANESKTACEIRIVRYSSYKKNKKDLDEALEERTKCNEKIKEYTLYKKELSKLSLEEEKKALELTTKKLHDLEFELQQLNQWEEAQKCMLADEALEDSTCQKCGLRVVETSEEKVHELQEHILGKQMELLDVKSNVKDQTSKVSEHEAHADVVETELYKALQKDSDLNLKIATLQEEVSEFDNPEKDPQEDRKIIADRLNDLSQKLDNLETMHIQWNGEKSALKTLMTAYDENREKMTEKRDFLRSSKFEVLGEYGETLGVYEERQLLYNEVKAKLEETNTLLSEVTEEYSKLLEKEEQSRKKRDLCAQLKSLKNIFSKKGIPKEYINSKFNIITELTQANLDILGTDFFIEPSKDKSLAFDFTRFVEAEKIKLPMSKLSGGQRVRLSLSFILSIQQLVMAEIGFITLDEPSTHLDEEGIDSLGDLLRKIRDIFADSEHQLWVCDHNPKLEASFDRTLILK